MASPADPASREDTIMRSILFAGSALLVMAAAPASAQTMGGSPMGGPTMGGSPMGGMMGGMMGSSGKSCVSNGQFVPCPPAGGMAQGAAMEQQPMTRSRMKRTRMRRGAM